MKFDGIEHCDLFDDESIFWTELSDAPMSIQNIAKEIDGENYDPRCFGMCICQDIDSKQFEVVQDIDISTGITKNIFYIDNDGEKHWLHAELSKEFINQAFAACGRMIAGKEGAFGYKVKESVLFADKYGIALLAKPNSKNPYAVSPFSVDEYGRCGYHWGELHKSYPAAQQDFTTRIAQYRQRHGVDEVSHYIAKQVHKTKKTKRHSKHKGKDKSTPVR